MTFLCPYSLLGIGLRSDKYCRRILIESMNSILSFRIRPQEGFLLQKNPIIESMDAEKPVFQAEKPTFGAENPTFRTENSIFLLKR
jgi:hypothetical protein